MTSLHFTKNLKKLPRDNARKKSLRECNIHNHKIVMTGMLPFYNQIIKNKPDNTDKVSVLKVYPIEMDNNEVNGLV